MAKSSSTVRPLADDAIAYHDRTKGHFRRWARSPGRLDWANQREAFRRFDGAPLPLPPLLDEDQSPAYDLDRWRR